MAFCSKCNTAYLSENVHRCGSRAAAVGNAPTMANARSVHDITLHEDDDGWAYGTCECGWVSPPCPDDETAAGFYGDHRAREAAN